MSLTISLYGRSKGLENYKNPTNAFQSSRWSDAVPIAITRRSYFPTPPNEFLRSESDGNVVSPNQPIPNSMATAKLLAPKYRVDSGSPSLQEPLEKPCGIFSVAFMN